MVGSHSEKWRKWLLHEVYLERRPYLYCVIKSAGCYVVTVMRPLHAHDRLVVTCIGKYLLCGIILPYLHPTILVTSGDMSAVRRPCYCIYLILNSTRENPDKILFAQIP